MMSPTAGLEIHVSAEMLTDPKDARRLAACFTVIRDHEISNGSQTEARFLDALMVSLMGYADELERTHDAVVRDASKRWFGDQP